MGLGADRLPEPRCRLLPPGPGLRGSVCALLPWVSQVTVEQEQNKRNNALQNYLQMARYLKRCLEGVLVPIPPLFSRATLGRRVCRSAELVWTWETGRSAIGRHRLDVRCSTGVRTGRGCNLQLQRAAERGGTLDVN